MKAFLIGTILFCVIITFYGDATYGQGSRFGAKQESESLEYEDVNSDGEYEYYTVGSLSALKYYTYEPGGLHTSKLSSYAGSSISLYTSNIPSYPYQYAGDGKNKRHRGHSQKKPILLRGARQQ